MAFAKAKILRFNEIKSCAPPPGAYNPKFEEHVTGTVISLKNRFPEMPSPSTTCSDTKSVQSCSSTPCFRTPTIPRRKKLTLLTNSAGRKCTVGKLFSPKQTEALREKMVECKNKDETIKDLESQVEELKMEISKLKAERDSLIEERDELVKRLEDCKGEYENGLFEIKEKYSEDIESINAQLVRSLADNKSMVEEFKAMKAELRTKNAAEMKQLQDNIELLEKYVKQSLEDAENTLKETEAKLSDKETACCNLQAELLKKSEEIRELEIKYEESLATQVELQRSHAGELESLKNFHRREVEDVEYEMLKVVTEWRNVVTKLETDHAKEINAVKKQEGSNLDVLREEYERREADLKESTQKIVKQSEEEAEQRWSVKMREELKEKEMNCNEALRKVEDQLARSRTELSCYEVTLAKTRATMDALKRRLLESDADVERLKERVEHLEGEHSLDVVETRVREVEMRLLARVDELRERADAEIARLNSIVDEKQRSISELSAFIHNQQRLHVDAQALIADAKVELERLEAQKTEYEFKICRLESTAQRAQAETAQLATENDKLRAEANALAELHRQNSELSARNAELEAIVAAQNGLINPLKEQLHEYERERELLLAEKAEAKAEARELDLKVAQLIGHQNYKQRLHHVIDLKKQCIEMRESKRELEAKLQQQSRTIERLRQELAQLGRPHRADKENAGCGSPAKPLAKTPTRFGSPLRERN